jgi:hypothetical protein
MQSPGRSALVALAIIAIVVAGSLRIARWGRIRADSHRLAQDMKQIRIALANFHIAQSKWPPAAKA